MQVIDQHWQNIDPIIVALLQTVLRLPHFRQFLIDKMDWTVCHPSYYYDQINRQYIIISTYWTLIDIGDSVGCLFNVDRNWRGASFQRVTPAMVSLTSPTSHSWKFQSVRDSVPTSLSPPTPRLVILLVQPWMKYIFIELLEHDFRPNEVEFAFNSAIGLWNVETCAVVADLVLSLSNTEIIK